MGTASTRKRRTTPLVLATLAAALFVGSHVQRGHALMMPIDHGRVAPTPSRSPALRPALDRAEARYERCALRSRFTEEALQAVSVRILISSSRVRDVSVVNVPEGRRARALRSCLRREVRRALRNRRLYRNVRQFRLDYAPLRQLSIPMEEPVREMTRLLDASEVAEGVSWLGATQDMEERLQWMRRLEEAGTGVALADASTLLSRFQGGRLTAAGLLCRVVVGRRPLRPIMRTLERTERARFRARTRGRCGTELAEPAPVTESAEPQPSGSRPPSPIQGGTCTSSADCVLACPGAPSCCVSPCGCNNAILRSDAAANQAYCAANGPAPECPGPGGYGCARQEYHAVCREGRCFAARGLGL